MPWQAGFRTFAEREACHGLPQKVDPDSLLPEDVYEDLVPVLRNDVRDQWKHRIQAGDLWQASSQPQQPQMASRTGSILNGKNIQKNCGFLQVSLIVA